MNVGKSGSHVAHHHGFLWWWCFSCCCRKIRNTRELEQRGWRNIHAQNNNNINMHVCKQSWPPGPTCFERPYSVLDAMSAIRYRNIWYDRAIAGFCSSPSLKAIIPNTLQDTVTTVSLNITQVKTVRKWGRFSYRYLVYSLSDSNLRSFWDLNSRL